MTSQQHLQRYVTEFEFRYNTRERLGANNKVRMNRALIGLKGKRLTYQIIRS